MPELRCRPPGARLPVGLGGNVMRVLFRLCAALIMLGVCGHAGAAFPERAIHIVVPFPPGGPVDVVAHILAPKLGERLGQSVTIDNVSGGDVRRRRRRRGPAPPSVAAVARSARDHLLANYATYYNGVRTHLALDKDTPLHRPAQTVGRIASVTWLGGLHRHYVRMA